MDEQLPQKPKSNNTAIISVVSIIITTLVVGGSIFAYQQNIIKKNQQEAKNYANNLQEQISKLNEQIDCDGTWNDEEGCIAPILNLLTPNGGETLCSNKLNTIRWIAPTDLDTIRIFLTTQSSSNEIGVVNANTGELKWDGQNISGYTVKPSDVYKIWLQANYNGENLEDFSDNTFSIEKCPIDTTSWEEYKNENLGISFLHPMSSKVQEPPLALPAGEFFSHTISIIDDGNLVDVYVGTAVSRNCNTYGEEIMVMGKEVFPCINGNVSYFLILAEIDKIIYSIKCSKPNSGICEEIIRSINIKPITVEF